MTADFPASPFWDFSLEVYGGDGVALACIRLQDTHGLDVNMLLLACWIGASGRGALSAADIAAARQASEIWNTEIVVPVRGVRQRLKQGVPPADPTLSEALRRTLQDIEIDLEHIEQLTLAAAVDRPADADRPEEARLGDAAGSLGAYMDSKEIGPRDGDREDLATLLTAAFPGAARDAIDAAIAERFD